MSITVGETGRARPRDHARARIAVSLVFVIYPVFDAICKALHSTLPFIPGES